MTNAFGVLSRFVKERALTETLRYLLDSNESHECGDLFFRVFLEAVGAYSEGIGNEIAAASEWVTAGGRAVDVVAVSRAAWDCPPLFVVGIEAKTDSKESREQLADYQRALVAAFPKATRLLVYLTVDGSEPTSADSDLERECPVRTATWGQIGSALAKHAEHSTVAAQFSSFVSCLSPTDGVIAREASKLVADLIVPEVKRLTKCDVKLSWQHPKGAPREYNLTFPALNTHCALEGLAIIQMLLCPSGVPMPGRQFYVQMMAYSPEHHFTRRQRKRVSELKACMPPVEGPTFEWGTMWQSLWGGGCRTMRDLSSADGEAVARLASRCYRMTEKPLRLFFQP